MGSTPTCALSRGGRSTGARSTWVEEPADATGCHALFVGRMDRVRLHALLSGLRELPVLTFGRQGDFLAAGGLVRFQLQGSTLKPRCDADRLGSSALRSTAGSWPCVGVTSRSTLPVSSGQSVSSQSTDTLGAPAGQGMTPCGPGISAITRRAVSR